MTNERLITVAQQGRYTSPWSLTIRLKVMVWRIVWLCFFRTTPRILRHWRLWLLKLFGCRIHGRPYVAASAKIKMPWNVEIEDHAAIGQDAEIYSLGKVVLKSRCTVSQQAYLCGGTHDFSDPDTPLVIGSIVVGEGAFIGARAFLLPGVHIGDHALIGACAVVGKDVEPFAVMVGNPAKFIRYRHINEK